MDLRYRDGFLPDDFSPQGALVQSLLRDDPLVKKLLELGCPVVRMGLLPHPDDRLVPAVVTDYPAVGRMAADHFAERGFKHLGYVGFKPLSVMKALYKGFEARAVELGCECHLFQFKSAPFAPDASDRYRHRKSLFAEWLKTVPKPLGLLGFVDGMAAKLCAMCADSGVLVPEEVAVLGVENILPVCEGVRPTLSSIVLDEDGKVEAAFNLLQKLIKGEPLEQATVMIQPLRVVVRESTDILAVGDREVASALRFMWSHLDLDLTIDDVAREVDLSRRHLTRRFRRAVGRTFVEEMRRKRLEETKRLLRTTDDTVSVITRKIGFRSPQYLHYAFCRAFSTTPRKYRAERAWEHAES